MSDVQSAGYQISFQSGFFGKIIDVNLDGMKREAMDNTNQANAVSNGYIWITKQPSKFIDAGQLKLKIRFDPTKVAPPINKDAETVTITHPIPAGGVTAATEAFTGFVTDVGLAAPFKNLVEQEFTIERSGEVTYTNGT